MPDKLSPTNPNPIQEADIYEVARQFVLAFALPALAADNVIQGWQNRVAPPAVTDYAVITVQSGTRRGSPVEVYHPEREELEISALIEYAATIDFYGDDDLCRQRAQRLAVMARSSAGVQFMNDRGLSLLYADDPTMPDPDRTDDTNQFSRCYRIVLHLSGQSGLVLDMPGTQNISLNKLHKITH